MTGNLFDQPEAFYPTPPGSPPVRNRVTPEKTGAQLRDDGAKAVLAPRPVFKELAARVIDDLAAQGKEFTAEAVQDAFASKYPQCPLPHHNAWGAVFLGAARRGVIAATGRTIKSTRPASHARRIQLWAPAGAA